MDAGPNHRFTVIGERGPFLVHNCDQAVSRDLLAHGIRIARSRGLDIRLHVHDQILALVPRRGAEEQLEILKQSMMTQPEWADKLPLGVGGHLSPLFIKD